jgi:membrane-associated phospholipid phosphatase
MGGLIVVTAVLGLSAVFAWTKTRDGTLTAFFLGTLIGALGLDDVIKSLVGRPRPVLGRLVHATGSSFPSGHALAATAMFGALAYVLARRSRPFSKTLIWGGALLLSSLVAASRVYLGVHWLTDVVGGMLLGAFWVALTFTVVRLTRGQDKLREVGRNV